MQKSVSKTINVEIRCWYLDGDLLASVRRGQSAGHMVTKCFSHRLSPDEEIIALRIGEYLKRRGIRLAAADILNGYLLELNFASPGLLVETEHATKENLATQIIRRLAKL